MRQTYFDIGDPRFEAFRSVESIANMFSVKDIRNSEHFSIPWDITNVRAALAMARINKSLGRIELAHEHARVGLRLCESAGALKGLFEEVLCTI